MFYYDIPWFYQDFKSVFLNLCFFKSVLSSPSENTGLSLEIMLSPPK